MSARLPSFSNLSLAPGSAVHGRQLVTVSSDGGVRQSLAFLATGLGAFMRGLVLKSVVHLPLFNRSARDAVKMQIASEDALVRLSLRAFRRKVCNLLVAYFFSQTVCATRRTATIHSDAGDSVDSTAAIYGCRDEELDSDSGSSLDTAASVYGDSAMDAMSDVDISVETAVSICDNDVDPWSSISHSIDRAVSIYRDSGADHPSEGGEDLVEFPKFTTVTYKDKTFTTQGLLGEGGFGRVFLALDELGASYAIKVIHKAKLVWEGSWLHANAVKTENAVMQRLTLQSSSPFLPQLLYAFEDTANFYLVMDVYPLTLRRLILENGPPSLRAIKLYAAELISAIGAIHEMNVMHRDLKPENVLIGADGHLAVADFSCCKAFTPNRPAKKCLSTEIVGTTGYQSPEMFLKKGITNWQADVWGFGLIVLEMFVGTGDPFFVASTEDPDAEVAITMTSLEIEKYVSDEVAQHLLSNILVHDPRKRLTVDQVKSHPFFCDINWASLHKREETPEYIPDFDCITTNTDSMGFSSWHAAHYTYADSDAQVRAAYLTAENFDFECPAELRRTLPQALTTAVPLPCADFACQLRMPPPSHSHPADDDSDYSFSDPEICTPSDSAADLYVKSYGEGVWPSPAGRDLPPTNFWYPANTAALAV